MRTPRNGNGRNVLIAVSSSHLSNHLSEPGRFLAGLTVRNPLHHGEAEKSLLTLADRCPGPRYRDPVPPRSHADRGPPSFGLPGPEPASVIGMNGWIKGSNRAASDRCVAGTEIAFLQVPIPRRVRCSPPFDRAGGDAGAPGTPAPPCHRAGVPGNTWPLAPGGRYRGGEPPRPPACARRTASGSRPIPLPRLRLRFRLQEPRDGVQVARDPDRPPFHRQHPRRQRGQHQADRRHRHPAAREDRPRAAPDRPTGEASASAARRRQSAMTRM